MKVYEGSGAIAPHILNLGIGSEWSAARAGRLTTGIKTPVRIKLEDWWVTEPVWKI